MTTIYWLSGKIYPGLKDKGDISFPLISLLIFLLALFCNLSVSAQIQGDSENNIFSELAGIVSEKSGEANMPADTIPSDIAEVVSDYYDEPYIPSELADIVKGYYEETYVPSDLADIVSGYYAEAVVPESVAAGVLGYLTNVYKEHGYYDTGNWARNDFSSRYRPKISELPKYKDEDFQLPAEGHLTSRYGYRPHFGKFHHGIDVSLNRGDTVRSVLPGVVSKTGYQRGGYGRYVVVSHYGGMETLYGHLQLSLVSPGDKLQPGQPLGLGGATGNATGPHLHFETRYRGVAIDPILWFNISY